MCCRGISGKVYAIIGEDDKVTAVEVADGFLEGLL